MLRDASTIKPTKRYKLKIMASVYDPIGFLQPAVVKLWRVYTILLDFYNQQSSNYGECIRSYWIFTTIGRKSTSN